VQDKWSPNYIKLQQRPREFHEVDPLLIGIEGITNLAPTSALIKDAPV